MSFQITRLDHVQLAMPRGAEALADSFYRDLLGFEVLERPPLLAARGGRWFASGGGQVQVHLGVEEEFRPARKAHPAFVVDHLPELVGRLEVEGHPVRWADDIPGVSRCHIDDPFGNRIELIDAS